MIDGNHYKLWPRVGGDGRDKSQSLPITDEVLDACGDVQLIMFQWLESIQSKGDDGARWHFGIIAKPEVVDDEGSMVTPAQNTGNRLGIRSDQCLFLDAAYQRRRFDRMEARISVIESKQIVFTKQHRKKSSSCLGKIRTT